MDFFYVFSVSKEQHIIDMFQVSVPAVDGLFFAGSKFTDKEKALSFRDSVSNAKAECYEMGWTVVVTKDVSWNPWVGIKLKYMEAL